MKITDIRQNPNYANYMKTKSWTVVEKDGVYYYIKKILFFALMKVQRPEEIRYKDIEILRKKYKILQIFLEPNTFKEADRLIKKNWKIAFPFVPSKTIFVNLDRPEKKIYEQMTKDTRYSIRKVQSSKLKIKNCEDFIKFRKSWKAAVDFKRYVLSVKDMQDLKKSFGKDSLFILAENGSAGGIFLRAKDTGYYWYGFVSKFGRKNLSQYQVVWEGIKWAKKRGAKYLDMEGIFDERFPIPAWRGFTHFKKGFGGKIKKFPGAYKKMFLPF